MFHGNSRLIRKSYVDEDLAQIFLAESSTNTNYTNYFLKSSPASEIHRAILEFLNRQGFGCSNKYIEYWFQKRQIDDGHWPHVDFNEFTRKKLADGETVPPEKLMSPITIACYLETDDLEGGEFCISERSWLDYEREIQPAEALLEELHKYTYETYKPTAGDVLYFEGSRYYHWINKITRGTRKSMLINFWNEVDLPLVTVS